MLYLKDALKYEYKYNQLIYFKDGLKYRYKYNQLLYFKDGMAKAASPHSHFLPSFKGTGWGSKAIWKHLSSYDELMMKAFIFLWWINDEHPLTFLHSEPKSGDLNRAAREENLRGGNTRPLGKVVPHHYNHYHEHHHHHFRMFLKTKVLYFKCCRIQVFSSQRLNCQVFDFIGEVRSTIQDLIWCF